MLATAIIQDRTDRGYRPAKAAEILGVSRATLWRWARDGRLSAKKIGPRTTIFLESEVRALLAGGAAAIPHVMPSAPGTCASSPSPAVSASGAPP